MNSLFLTTTRDTYAQGGKKVSVRWDKGEYALNASSHRLFIIHMFHLKENKITIPIRSWKELPEARFKAFHLQARVLQFSEPSHDGLDLKKALSIEYF